MGTDCLSTGASGTGLSAKDYLILLSANARPPLLNVSDSCIVCPCLSSVPISSATTENMGREQERLGEGRRDPSCPLMHQPYNLVTGVIKLLKEQLITNCYY